ncbi:MOLPALP family lipoprotein [Mesoplasma syrphidae]|uniref:MOLPALP family lipoprotein n=1 Tax=Mesoplasma syrphidae TaxID=225999 RepID=A0A2K9BMS5_9MOLU|nr:MOLPALP family lipoprotein [Mesoplasma syrphidae]AUF83343.1 MOLPALP family lipoprotein [Mesoplasma syrphidae]
MKKMLAVLGAVSLAASSSVTVVACTPKIEEPSTTPDPSTYNNSLANLQGSAALVAKKAILADQHRYSYQTLQNKMGIKLAEKQVNSLNMDGKVFDNKDRGLDEYSTVSELESRYFGTNTSLLKTELTDNINLNGNLGNGKGAVSQAVPENIAGILELVMQILPVLSTESINSLVGGLGPILKLPDLNDTLGSNIVSAISLAAKIVLDNSSDLINKEIESMNVVEETQNVSLENLTGAMFISLTNGIAFLKDSTHKTLTISSDEEIKQNLASAAKIIVQSGSAKSSLGNLDMDSIIKNIPQYIKAIKEFVKMAQLLQMSLSLYDSTKNVNVIDGNHLFDSNTTNGDYYKNNIKGKKVSTTFASSNINLKYILTALKYHVGSLNSKEDPEGRNFQKLLFALFGDDNSITVTSGWFPKVNNTFDFKNKNASSGTNFIYYVIQELLTDEILESVHKAIKDIKVPVIGSITSMTKEDFIKMIRDDQFYYLIGNLFYALSNDKGVIDASKGPLNQILSKLNGLAATAIYFPKYMTENLYSSLYRGNFKTDFSLDFKVLGVTVSSINVWEKLPENIQNTVNDFLGGSDVPMNIKSVLNKSLGSFIGKTDSQGILGEHYLKLTIPELINDITGDFGIDETKTLKNLQSYGIYIEDFKSLFNNHILNNKYVDSQGKEHMGNIVSQIVENLPELFNILGINKDGVTEGSVWEFIVNHFLAPNEEHLQHEVKQGQNITFNGKTKFAKSAEDLENVFKTFFETGPKNKLLYLKGKEAPEGFTPGSKLTEEKINSVTKMTLDEILKTDEKDLIVVNYYEGENIVVENNSITLAKVNLDNIDKEQELTDHLPELLKGIVNIYNKLNVITDLSLEMNERFMNESLYSWTFENPELMNDKVSIKSQRMSVLYKNPKTNQDVRYNFLYSRESINKVFSIDYMEKQ